MAAKKLVKKPVSKGRKVSRKKLQKGTVGNFFVFGVLALLMVLGITAVGGLPSQEAPSSGQIVNVVTPTTGPNYNNLQLKTFGYVTIVPTPTPDANNLCNNKAINTEQGILLGYYPGPGQSASSSDSIKVWVTDENPPFVAPNEQVNSSTGAVTEGDRTAKADDGYLFEPALYISPHTAESGGSPYFPNYIKGNVNNDPTSAQGGFMGRGIAGINGPAVDPIPAGASFAGVQTNCFGQCHNAEYIWSVSQLGLTTGTYQVEFVAHDGDRDRGIGCVSVTIK